MLYLIIERFRDGDPVPVYRRFLERGRQASAGLTYVSSWVTSDLTTRYQIMECSDRALLDEWMARWRDMVDFDVVAVRTSADAITDVTPRL